MHRLLGQNASAAHKKLNLNSPQTLHPAGNIIVNFLPGNTKRHCEFTKQDALRLLHEALVHLAEAAAHLFLFLLFGVDRHGQSDQIGAVMAASGSAVMFPQFLQIFGAVRLDDNPGDLVDQSFCILTTDDRAA